MNQINTNIQTILKKKELVRERRKTKKLSKLRNKKVGKSRVPTSTHTLEEHKETENHLINCGS